MTWTDISGWKKGAIISASIALFLGIADHLVTYFVCSDTDASSGLICMFPMKILQTPFWLIGLNSIVSNETIAFILWVVVGAIIGYFAGKRK